MNTILLDTDILCYRAASSVQKDIDWGDGLYTCHAYLSDAEDVLADTLNAIKGELEDMGYKNNFYIFCLSDKENFRKTLNPSYKSNRANHRKPTCYYGLIDSLKKSIDPSKSAILSHKGLEGDDTIGIAATGYAKRNPDGDVLIVSMDKDFKTIPCDFYNFKSKDMYNNSLQLLNAFNNTIYQVLTGDITDGYKGAKGYGKKTASKLIDQHKSNPEELWKHVVDKAFKGDEEEALLQYRMAHILWDSEYDFTKEKVVFKHPLELLKDYKVIDN